jgi:hypothetical protein
MVDYAVGYGVKGADGRPVPHTVISAIEATAAKLGVREGEAGDGKLSADEHTTFELAYYDLASVLAPVTADTLRNTAGSNTNRSLWARVWHADSPARGFSRKLFFLSVAFALFVVGANWYLNYMAEVADTKTYASCRIILELLTPWMYGALGACVYLLRSAHIYIYQRSFDVRREPEYFNRLLLGAIAGGAITLFANHLVEDDGTVIQLSSAAIGFLAGYNTDLLFAAMERVSNALLPKIGIETVQRAPQTSRPVDLNELAKLHAKAKGADKDVYKAIIDHATEEAAKARKGRRGK